jgi:hypothetical protein
MLDFSSFTRARHELWLERSYGVKAGGEADSLRPFHYTNLWRELDRGTIYLFNHIQRPSLANPLKLVRDTILYRTFNLRETYEVMIDRWGEDFLQRVRSEELHDFLSRRERNFNGCYMRCNKLSLICKQLTALENTVEELVMQLGSGHGPGARKTISTLYSFGGFTGDQLMMDLCWQGGPFDVEFQPKYGPGAQRGLQHCLDAGHKDMDELLECGSLAIPPETRPVFQGKPIVYDFRTLEHTLCEYSKYVKLERRNGKQVKMRNYKPSELKAEPLPFSWTEPSIVPTITQAGMFHSLGPVPGTVPSITQ